MRNTSFAVSLLLALVIFAASPALRAQAPAPSAPPGAPASPTIQVVTREVVLDVSVTDAKGNFVHGLKQEDFTVKEDNKPQPIRSFQEYTAQTVPPLPKLQPNVHTNLQPPPASDAVNLFLLDGLNTAPADDTDPTQVTWSASIQAIVKQEAKKYLQTMPPGTRVGILGLSRSLRVLQGFSSDPALLSAAVDTAEFGIDGRGATPQQWCAQQDVRNRMTLEALSQIAADAASIKGKKNLIWFSTGIPVVTDPSVNFQVKCDSGFSVSGPSTGSNGVPTGPAFAVGNGLPDPTPALLKTYSLLAAAQVTIYLINPQALLATGWVPNPVGPGTILESKDPMGYAQTIAAANLSLESIAEATGGAAYHNSNDLAGEVAQAVDKGDNFYAISYVPPGKKFDNGHHKIKIESAQPGLHLVYRPTYDAIDPASIKPPPGLTLAAQMPESQAGDIRAAMSRSMPISTQLLFTVEVDPTTQPPKPTDPPIMGALDPKLKDKPLTRYDFAYAMPARQIAFADAPDGAGRKFSLDFDIAAYDGQGRLLTSLSQTIQPVITAEQAQQLTTGPFRFFQQLDLPAGPLFLRIGVHDANSNKIGTLEIPLAVAKK